MNLNQFLEDGKTDSLKTHAGKIGSAHRESQHKTPTLDLMTNKLTMGEQSKSMTLVCYEQLIKGVEPCHQYLDQSWPLDH